jgi:hypothetical protein
MHALNYDGISNIYNLFLDFCQLEYYTLFALMALLYDSCNATDNQRQQLSSFKPQPRDYNRKTKRQTCIGLIFMGGFKHLKEALILS